jgi:hypothetical protein
MLREHLDDRKKDDKPNVEEEDDRSHKGKRVIE